MTQPSRPSLTREQEAKLSAALEIAKIAERKAKEASDFATALAEKYQRYLHEANSAATEEKGENL